MLLKMVQGLDDVEGKVHQGYISQIHGYPIKVSKFISLSLGYLDMGTLYPKDTILGYKRYLGYSMGTQSIPSILDIFDE